MMLMVWTFMFLPMVSSEDAGKSVPVVKNYVNDSTDGLPKTSNSERLTSENDSSFAQVEQGIDDVPNYLPTGFHDFISSDQGPTYSYDKTGTKSKQYSRFSSWGPFMQDLGSMFGIYPSSKDSYPKRSPKDASYRMVKPYIWYSADAKVKKYPVPEDRLPPTYRSAENVKRRQISSPTSAKPRKARFVKNLFGYKPNNPWWSDGMSNADYRPEDIYMMMSTMKNGIDRGDQTTDDGYSDNSPSAIFVDPVPVVLAILLPISMMLAACLPLLLGGWMNGGGGSIPLVTTTATGNMGKTLEVNSSQDLSPVPDNTDSFSPRSGEVECTMKALCRKMKADSTLYSWQRAISEVSTLMEDSYWFKILGLEEIIQTIRDGKCERIRCFKSQALTDYNPERRGDNDSFM